MTPVPVRCPAGWEWAGTWCVEFDEPRDESYFRAPDVDAALAAACCARSRDRSAVSKATKVYRPMMPVGHYAEEEL